MENNNNNNSTVTRTNTLTYDQWLRQCHEKMLAARYHIVNPSTNTVLAGSDDIKIAQHYWNHIPRRKTSVLYFVDNTTGEILKTKPKKEIK